MTETLVLAGSWEGAVPPDAGYTAGQSAWSELHREPPFEALMAAAHAAPAAVVVHPDEGVLASCTPAQRRVLATDSLRALLTGRVAAVEPIAAPCASSGPLAVPPTEVFLPWLRTGPAELIAEVVTQADAAPPLLAAAGEAAVALCAPTGPHPPPLAALRYRTPAPLSVAEALHVSRGARDVGVGWEAWFDLGDLLAQGPDACDALAERGCIGAHVDVDGEAMRSVAVLRRAVPALGRRGIATWATWRLGGDVASRADAEARLHLVVALGCAGLRVALPQSASPDDDLPDGPWSPEPAPPRFHPVLENHELAALGERAMHLAYTTWGPSRLQQLRVHAAGVRWAEEHGEGGEGSRRVHAAALRRLRPYGRALERFAPTPAVAALVQRVLVDSAGSDTGDRGDAEAQERFILSRMLRETRKRQRGSRGSEAPPADAWRLRFAAAGGPAAVLSAVEVLTDRAEAARLARNRARFLATAPPA